MKRILSLLLILIFLPLLASCDKEEIKDIEVVEVNTMLAEAKTNTVENSVEVISFDASFDVKFDQKVTSAEKNTEVKYTFKGKVNAVLDYENFEAHLGMKFDYTIQMVELGLTTTGNVELNGYVDDTYVYLDVNISASGSKTTLQNKFKHGIPVDQFKEQVLLSLTQMDLSQALQPGDDFKMYKVGNKFEFVQEVDLAKQNSTNQGVPLPDAVGMGLPLDGYTIDEGSMVKLSVLFGEVFEAFDFEFKVKGSSEQKYFEGSPYAYTENQKLDLDLNVKLNLKGKAKRIDFNKFKDFIEIDPSTIDIGNLLGGMGGLSPRPSW